MRDSSEAENAGKNKKSTCIYLPSMLLYKGCGMIAMKREVAARE